MLAGERYGEVSPPSTEGNRRGQFVFSCKENLWTLFASTAVFPSPSLLKRRQASSPRMLVADQLALIAASWQLAVAPVDGTPTRDHECGAGHWRRAKERQERMQRGSGDDGCTPPRFHGKMFDDTYIFVTRTTSCQFGAYCGLQFLPPTPTPPQ